MNISPSRSALLGPLISDPATAELFSDTAVLAAMLEFEATLAEVEGRLGLIPVQAATEIATVARTLQPDPAKLGAGTAASGHPVGTLLGLLRSRCGLAGSHVHRGATAQDVVDTALVIQLRKALNGLDKLIQNLIKTLAVSARRYRGAVVAGRTRSQQAVPVSFGLKVAGWLAPLGRHRRRLVELRPRVLAVQFGGAAGTLGTLGDRGTDVMAGLAQALDLAVPPTPWHSQRDGLAELAGWLALVTGSLAKMGRDLVLLGQTEVAEASDGSQGASTAMPQKSNPVRSETLVAIGRANAGLLASMHQAMIHEHERDGSAWTLEWMTLPQMTELTAGSLRVGLHVAQAVEVDAGRMIRNITRAGNQVLAEAAVVALTGPMREERARRVVAEAAQEAKATGKDLIAILEQLGGNHVDWTRMRDPGHWLGSADEFIERAIESAGKC